MNTRPTIEAMPEYDIDIAAPCPAWEREFPRIHEIIEHTVLSTLKTALPNQTSLEISIVLADDAFIQNLNKTYRQKDKPTNVLSFPQTEPEELANTAQHLCLGDIILAYETIAREAVEQNKPLMHHLQHMLVHGCLHLLHYDHENETDAEAMESLEVNILKSLNISNPYVNEL